MVDGLELSRQATTFLMWVVLLGTLGACAVYLLSERYRQPPKSGNQKRDRKSGL